jgi:DNA-3-methyladenine glycosylase II
LAALAIVGRMVERYGRRLDVDGRTYFAYPEAESIELASVEELRGLGLSLNKALSLRALAEQVGTGEGLRDELMALPSPAAIERLVKLPGIGRWSAEVVLLRGLGRLDVFPGADSGVIRGLAEALGRAGGLEKGEERRLADRFGDWRGMLYLLVAGYRIQRLGLLPGTDLST